MSSSKVNQPIMSACLDIATDAKASLVASLERLALERAALSATIAEQERLSDAAKDAAKAADTALSNSRKRRFALDEAVNCVKRAKAQLELAAEVFKTGEV